VKEYSTNRHVRQRMVEFLGGASLEQATAVYLTRCDLVRYDRLDLKKPVELDYFLDNALDVGRSLWDRDGLLADLDIEYVNFDFPAEPYLDPARSFFLQEPVVAAVKEMLSGLGMEFLHLVSGRGHHFVWRVPWGSAAFARLGRLTEGFLTRLEGHKATIAGLEESVAADWYRAFTGLGLVMEYLALELKGAASGQCALPVELSAVATGPGARGREIVSIDITEYGDPLQTRMLRMPFSIYLKPWIKDIGLDRQTAGRIPTLIMIPEDHLEPPEMIRTMQSPHEAARLAERTTTSIPAAASAMEQLLDRYLRSDLRRFHAWFYNQHHQPHGNWPETYDRIPLDMLPGCVRRIILRPNDLLLVPANIQLLVRTLLALGWHPRHIAGLIRSRYERDHGWGTYWLTYDAADRADFYTRLFTAQFVTGKDDLVDYNCVSTQEKGLCPATENCSGLEDLNRSLLARRASGRLGSEPFNTVLVPPDQG